MLLATEIKVTRNYYLYLGHSPVKIEIQGACPIKTSLHQRSLQESRCFLTQEVMAVKIIDQNYNSGTVIGQFTINLLAKYRIYN